MLKEVECRQIPNEPFRRWICDDFFDLIVWFAGHPGGVLGFQLCYGKPYQEQALTWFDGQGFSHAVVDGGDVGPFSNCTPILTTGGVFRADEVRREFLGRSAGLDAELRDLVLGKITEYSANSGA
jgi:hypothetical protein